MPTLEEIKNDIEAITGDSKGRFNQQCESKIHKTHIIGEYGAGYWDDIDQLADDVEALSSEDFATLQASLMDSKKLSVRPC